MSAAGPVLEAEGLTKRFPKRAGLLRRPVGMLVAVDHVDISIARGERLGLVGESGCGKTTLAKMLVGLLPPSEGTVRVGGRPYGALTRVEWLSTRRSVQMIFQHPQASLNPRRTVEETLAEPLLIHRLAEGPSGRRARVSALLAAVHVPERTRHRLPRELSGGECQRVGIARALAIDPDLLICDEPIASLGVSVGAKILELLRTLSQTRKMALLFISHDLGAVASLCERTAVMSRGRLLELAPTEQILERPSHPYTELLIRSASLDLDAVPGDSE